MFTVPPNSLSSPPTWAGGFPDPQPGSHLPGSCSSGSGLGAGSWVPAPPVRRSRACIWVPGLFAGHSTFPSVYESLNLLWPLLPSRPAGWGRACPRPPLPLCLPSACSGVRDLGRNGSGALQRALSHESRALTLSLSGPTVPRTTQMRRLASPKRGDTDLPGPAALLWVGVNRVGVGCPSRGWRSRQRQGPKHPAHPFPPSHMHTRVQPPRPRQAGGSGPSLSPASQGSQFPLRAFSTVS